jgi:hypothetical protein
MTPRMFWTAALSTRYAKPTPAQLLFRTNELTPAIVVELKPPQ